MYFSYFIHEKGARGVTWRTDRQLFHILAIATTRGLIYCLHPMLFTVYEQWKKARGVRFLVLTYVSYLVTSYMKTHTHATWHNLRVHNSDCYPSNIVNTDITRIRFYECAWRTLLFFLALTMQGDLRRCAKGSISLGDCCIIRSERGAEQWKKRKLCYFLRA